MMGVVYLHTFTRGVGSRGGPVAASCAGGGVLGPFPVLRTAAEGCDGSGAAARSFFLLLRFIHRLVNFDL